MTLDPLRGPALGIQATPNPTGIYWTLLYIPGTDSTNNQLNPIPTGSIPAQYEVKKWLPTMQDQLVAYLNQYAAYYDPDPFKSHLLVFAADPVGLTTQLALP